MQCHTEFEVASLCDFYSKRPLYCAMTMRKYCSVFVHERYDTLQAEGQVTKRDGYSGDDDDDDDFSDREAVVKRSRIGYEGFSDFGDRFGETEPSAEFQLDALLAAEGLSSKSMNVKGTFPKGKGKGDGLGGSAGGPLDPQEPSVETKRMDFTRLSRTAPSRAVPVPKDLVEYLMTPEHRQLLTEESGADVEWVPDDRQVDLRGSAEQVRRATRLIQRVVMHTRWGKSDEKVRRLLRPRIIESTICRLSPMNTLRPIEKLLSGPSPLLSIGKDRQNDAVIPDPIISRHHCIIELDSERGAVYAIDCSTNGTYLNGLRLPSKHAGKVLLSHGDELLFKDPGAGEPEFGYIVNLNELHVRAETRLEAPRRLLTAEEMSSVRRDFE